MRIALATDWWPPRIGGVESQVSDLADALTSRGHDVRVLTTTRNPTGVDKVEHLDVPMMGPIAVPDPRRVSSIAARIDAHKPDVLHAHGMFSSLAIGALLAADRLKLPSVLTVHSLLRPLPVFASAAAVFSLFSNRAAVLTGVSAATIADVRKASGRLALQVANGLTLADWSRIARAPEGIRAVAVTRLAPKKRPIDLVRAIATAVRRAPRLPIGLDIAGDGPERPRLEREAERLGVRDRITFHGDCSRAKVRDLLAGASLLAHPGANEAFGLAVLEARASGVPVVAMASGGLPELVDHGRHGLLARSRAEFHDFVALMAADAGLRRRCAEEAPRNLDAYDWSRVVQQHEAAYARALSGPRSLDLGA